MGLGKTFSKILFIGAGLALIGSAAGAAFGVWVFNTETSHSADVDYEADPIEENAIFADGYDYAETGARAYDVYFMAQMCDIETHVLEWDGSSYVDVVQLYDNDSSSSSTTGTVTSVKNYTLKEHPVPYHVDSNSSDPDSISLAYVDNDTSTYSTDNSTAPQDYGMWMSNESDSNPVGLTCDITQNQNRYFKRYQSVKELTADVIEDQVGHPHFRLSDKNGWNLSFLSWTPCYNLPVYYMGGTATWDNTGDFSSYFPREQNNLFPASGDRIPNASGNNNLSNRRATGYAPYTSVFTSLYAGTLFEYYERMSSGGDITYTNTLGNTVTNNYVWYINGRPSIFFFPTYTSDGKNYINSNYRKDTIKLWTRDSDTNAPHGNTLFTYDGVFTTEITAALEANENTSTYASQDGVRYECYRLPRTEYSSSYSYDIETDTNKNGAGWGGNWKYIYEFIPELVEGDYINIYLITKIDTETTTSSSSKPQYDSVTKSQVSFSRNDDGTYSKTSTTVNDTYVTYLTEAERTVIDSALDDLGISQYFSRPGTVGTLAGGTNLYELASTESRDYYVVYERLYEPKLTAGPHGNIEYENNEHHFIKQGVDEGLNHNFILRNVDLSGTKPDGEYTYPVHVNGSSEWTYVKVHYPSTYFSILMTSLTNIFYQNFEYYLVHEKDMDTGAMDENVPRIDTSTTFDGNNPYFSSMSIFQPVFPYTWTSPVTNTAMSYEPSSDTSSTDYNPDWVDTYDPSTVDAYVQISTDGVTFGEPMTLKAAYETNSDQYALRKHIPALKVRHGEEGVYTLMFTAHYNDITRYFAPNDSGGYTEYVDRPSTGEAGVDYYVINRHLPDLLTVWGYSFSDKFINICDITTNPNHLVRKTEANKTQYVNAGVYTYGSEDLPFGSYLSTNTLFWTLENRDGEDPDLAVTFGDLYNQDVTEDKEMVDLVTGQIITADNVSEFYVERYSIFVIKYKNQDIAYSSV